MQLPPGFNLDMIKEQMNKQQGANEDDEIKLEYKMSTYIRSMDEELQGRFKALKVMTSMLQEADKEEQKEIRKLEVEFESKYKDIYRMREELINGKSDLDKTLIEQFDLRAEKMKDDDYDKVEVSPCDVKSIQNSPVGVSDFWMKALLNHPMGEMISEKDRPILGYLQNIELDLHDEEKGEGFDLIFTFADNSYFSPSVLKKEIHMKHKGLVDKMQSTEIEWKDGCDPTRKKIQKKKKGKKVKMEVKCESFFNFFKDEPESKEKGDD